MAQQITTTFRPATNVSGSRILVKSWMGSKAYAWDHSLNSRENHLQAIDAYVKDKLADFPWSVLAVGETIDGSGKCAIVESVKAFEDSVTAEQWDAKHYA